ncbi:MAG: nucleotidyltransferase domain-containing protein [Clostridiales bacterium]|nr:nucleotidyltransferase domain-containing protein [Clostridiales bacterium]
MRKAIHRGLYEHQKSSIDYIISKMNHSTSPWIEKVILFGSCATKKNRFDSDVDVLFVTNDRYREYKDQMLDIKRELIGLSDDRYAEVDPKFLSEAYVAEGETTFLQNVKNEGVILWTRNHT